MHTVGRIHILHCVIIDVIVVHSNGPTIAATTAKAVQLEYENAPSGRFTLARNRVGSANHNILPLVRL